MDLNLGLAVIGYIPGRHIYSLPSTLSMRSESGMENVDDPDMGYIRFNYRDGGGHVCIFITLDDNSKPVLCASGNSHDMVSYMRYTLGSEVCFLKPFFKKYLCNPEIVVECACDQVGYTEGKGNMTPFGEFTGANGAAWCASFTAWCFYHSYQPRLVPVGDIIYFVDKMEELFGEGFYEWLPYKEALEDVPPSILATFNSILVAAVEDSDDDGYFQPDFFELEWEAYGDLTYSELSEWTSGQIDSSTKISSYKTTSYKQKILDEGGTQTAGNRYNKRGSGSSSKGGTSSKGTSVTVDQDYNVSTVYKTDFDGQIWGNSQLAIYASRLSNGSYFSRPNRADHVTVHNAFSECTIQELAAMCNSSDKGYNYGVDYKGTIGVFVDEQLWTNSCDNWEHDMFGINIICSGTGAGFSEGAIEKLTDLLEDVYRRNFIYLVTFNGNLDDTLTLHSYSNPSSGCPGSAAEAQLKEIAREVNGRLSAKISTNFVQMGSRLADSETNALRTQSLVNIRQIRPYVIKVDKYIDPGAIDIDYFYESGIVGAFVDVGYCNEVTKYDSEYVYRAVEAVRKGLPFGFVIHSTASNFQEVKNEAYWLRFIISKTPPKLGVWLSPEFYGGDPADLVDEWYAFFVDWGLKSKCGLYCSLGQASNIGWPRQANYMPLWLSGQTDAECADDELLTPTYFQLGNFTNYGTSNSNGIRTGVDGGSSRIIYRQNETYEGELQVIQGANGVTTVMIPQVSHHRVTKKWESYTAITNKKTINYKLTHSANTTTDELGFRKYDGRYLIAVGSGVCAQTGTYMDVKLADGTVIPCIMGDGKADVHTDSQNIYTNVNENWCCSEFIMDRQAKPWSGGDCSTVNGWDSPVVEITVYNKQVVPGDL